MTHRTAVVLFNLGGPDALAAVRPFLYNLFSDPDIFKFPLGAVTQKLFAWLISTRRTPEATKGYAALGGKSPLLENTQHQQRALAHALAPDGNFEIFICMRYWHPRATAVVAELKRQGFEHVILLPLYPQYSLTTSGSSYNEFQRECERAGYRPQVSFIRQWFEQADYQRAIGESLRREAAAFPDPDPAHIEVLFSAHGLPRKIVDRGDPYEQHIRATYDALCAQLSWPRATLCYQSRVGPLEWLRPYAEDVIREKAAAGAKQMLVYPIAFVSDHVETLYELSMTYAALAHKCGVAHYRVCPALNDDPLLIQALRHLVLTATEPRP
ncbi:MAG: ferrochelatase [Gammaproteobacteria bacterium]|nr:ferrochelatase [Gammaproteobacteria bacterium]